MASKVYDVIIIGGGVSGLAAAMYSGRLGLKTAVIAKLVGGTILMTRDIANYPGFKQISGMDLANNLEEHAKEYNIDIIRKTVTEIEQLKTKSKCFSVKTAEDSFIANSIIFATGTDWRKLNVPGERTFNGRGVHYCALCDGAFYQNKIVAVIGGSDSAVKEAQMLTEYAKKVYIIYRKDKLRAEEVSAKKVLSNKKIEVIYNTNVTEVIGDKFVTKILLDKPYKGKKEFPLDAIFIDIGHIPLSDLAKSVKVKLNDKREIIVDKEAKTNVQGIFASGDVTDIHVKQAITGVAQGVIAAYSAYHYVTGKDYICEE